MARRGSARLRAARRLIGLMLAVCLHGVARAEVRLAAVFADHAVLQRDVPLPIWGWAEPGEAVEVALGDATGRATAGADGRWQVTLPAQPGARTPLALVVQGSNHPLRATET
jgi:sialate O-acetylesterase